MQNNPYIQSTTVTPDQPVNIETQQYSGFWRRLGASIIDSIIISLPGMLVGGSISSFTVSIGMPAVIGFLYYPFFDSSALKSTPGKALLNMIVVTEKGERLSFKAAALRYFASFLSALICYIGYFMQPFTKKRQTLHDIIAEVVVIDTEVPDLNYFTVWKDQFKSVFNKL
ncbi:RDD family protein [bacterium]|nr:RDD family protein [bacterium]